MAIQIQDKKIDALTAIKEREDTIKKTYGLNIPVNPNAYYAAVDVYKEKKDTKKLVSVYQYLITLYPNEADSYIGLGEALESSNSTEAIKYYKTALIHIDPNDTEKLTKTKTKIQQLSSDKK